MCVCVCVCVEAHSLFVPDNPMQSDNIRVFELPHDGSLLQELDSVHLHCSRVQSLYGHLHGRGGRLPHTPVHSPKLP